MVAIFPASRKDRRCCEQVAYVGKARRIYEAVTVSAVRSFPFASPYVRMPPSGWRSHSGR